VELKKEFFFLALNWFFIVLFAFDIH
jgi:hypothetical protein